MQNRITEAGQAPDLRPSRLSCAILVELIVVLVILAILAAILVPALLGWIDEARKKQYVLEARNIYVAAQAVADEAYANDTEAVTGISVAKLDENGCKRIMELADLSEAPEIQGIYLKDTYDATKNNRKDAYTLVGMAVVFKASDNKYAAARLVNNKWDIATVDTKDAAAGAMPDEPDSFTGVWIDE